MPPLLPLQCRFRHLIGSIRARASSRSVGKMLQNCMCRLALGIVAIAWAGLPAAAQAPAKAAAPKQAPAPAPAAAAGGQPALLGQYGDWGAYAATSGSGKVCYALAMPGTTRTTPPNRPRDPTYLF